MVSLFLFQMMNEQNTRPCELILKIGSNEFEEISTALANLFRSCSIIDEKFFVFERQIQTTNYYNSYTNHLSTLKTTFPCQSISCVIFLTDELIREQKTKDFFKIHHLWKFHHKIELINEYKQTLARQDYYELSSFLPLWSFTHIPHTKQIIIRFNIFTNNFDSMIQFYENLFQRKPDSSKIGFVLYYLSSSSKTNMIYQFSIKYSSSINAYSISQSSHLKFYLNNLARFLQQYSSKLFTINSSEYYIYDPDGNLLHLYVQNSTSNLKQSLTTKTFLSTNDSGFGDSSSDPSILTPTIHLSNDSGQCSSISSNRSITKPNRIAVRTANENETNYRLKQRSIYESQLYFPTFFNTNNRYYSSMINMQTPRSFKATAETSYEVDTPRTTDGYLNAYLLKKQQINSSRPKSATLFNPILSISSNSSKLRSKSVTFDWENSSTDDEENMNISNQHDNSRINIGITLDSRLRKTPVLDMLRSTTMRLNRTDSFRYSSTPIARF